VARLTPVFKRKDLTEFSDNQLSQVFERLLYVRMLEFLDLQGVINPGQYAFRFGYFSAMVIQDMVERVSGAWDSKRATLGEFTDLK
jgi:hypothetical protein